MAAQRITMRKIGDILRLRFVTGLSIRQIKESTNVSIGAIQKLLIKAKELELSWPLPNELDDTRLVQLFYPNADTSSVDGTGVAIVLRPGPYDNRGKKSTKSVRTMFW